MAIVGWIVFALVALYGAGCYASQSRDPGVRWMMKVKGAALFAACAASLVLPFSKLWLLASAPVASVLPMVLMSRRAKSLNPSDIIAMREEADRTGIPFEEIVQRKYGG